MHHGLHTPKNARVLYLDMNAFFASIEQQRNPELRGKPVAVVSHVGPAGTVLASSYEAKAYGIKTGMRLREAWQLCPKLITPETSFLPYRVTHRHFMAILRDVCGPEVRACSVDEAVIPLSPNWQGSEKAHDVALEIKRRFKEELGEYIRCSIGIAPNHWLGKFATDIRKPDGLLEVTLQTTAELLSTVELPDLCGIAEGNTKRLNRYGITTPVELYEANEDWLRRTYGIWGQHWYWRLHGYESFVDSGPLKSMSHEHALKHWAHSRAEVAPVVDRLADRLIHRLRHNHFQCRQVGIFVRVKDYGSHFFHRDLHIGNQTYSLLLTTIHQLLEEIPAVPPGPIKKVGIYFGGLVQAANGFQMDLFSDGKSERMSVAIEQVREKFGFKAIAQGTVVGLNPKVAEEKLGFGRVKDL